MVRQHILLVDDEPELVRVMGDLLGMAGFQVTGAHGGNEAYDLVDANPFDFIITDLRMGDGTGIELIERIAERGPDAPKIAAASAYTDHTLAELLDRGAVDLIAKPIDMKALKALVHRHTTPPEERWAASAGGAPGLAISLPDAATAQATGVLALGQGGMFIASALPPAENTSVSVALQFDGGEPLAAEGVVRWTRPRQTPHFHAGFGLELTGLAPATLAWLRGALAKAVPSAYVPIGTRPRGV